MTNALPTAEQFAAIRGWPMQKLIERQSRLGMYMQESTYSSAITDHSFAQMHEYVRAISQEILLREYHDHMDQKAAEEAVKEPAGRGESALEYIVKHNAPVASSDFGPDSERRIEFTSTIVPYSKRLSRLLAARRLCGLQQARFGTKTPEAKRDYANCVKDALFSKMTVLPFNVSVVPQSELPSVDDDAQVIDATTAEGMNFLKSLMRNPPQSETPLNYKIKLNDSDMKHLKQTARKKLH